MTANNYKFYKCWIKGDKQQTGEEEVEALCPEQAAEIFADNWMLEDNQEVVVKGAGTYNFWIEQIYHASRVV